MASPSSSGWWARQTPTSQAKQALRPGAERASIAMFKHEDFQFGYEIALGSAYRGYADAGVVLSTAGRVEDGDADAWVREWCATAERLAADAEKAEDARRLVSARGAYLRAANYYSTGCT
jgi:hypothetical protein